MRQQVADAISTGVPILKVGRGKYFIERLPGALE